MSKVRRVAEVWLNRVGTPKLGLFWVLLGCMCESDACPSYEVAVC